MSSRVLSITLFQESKWLPLLAIEASRRTFYCDLCDEEFDSEKSLSDHEAKHEVCGLDGCKYTAMPEVM